MLIHIHQGGTVRAYCGRPLAINSRTVAWEEAPKATCTECLEHFPQVQFATPEWAVRGLRVFL
jgi:hypothetical protein